MSAPNHEPTLSRLHQARFYPQIKFAHSAKRIKGSKRVGSHGPRALLRFMLPLRGNNETALTGLQQASLQLFYHVPCIWPQQWQLCFLGERHMGAKVFGSLFCNDALMIELYFETSFPHIFPTGLKWRQLLSAQACKALQNEKCSGYLRMALIGLIALIALFALSVLFTGLLFHFLRLTADIVRVPFSFLSWSFCRLDLITWGLKGKTPQALQLLAGTSSTMVWCFVS